MDDDDLRALEEQLIRTPAAGRVMKNTGGVRKIRFAPAGGRRGKSGGFRVGYLFCPKHEAIYLVLVFSKHDQPNLTADQERMCRTLAKAVEDSLSQSRS